MLSSAGSQVSTKVQQRPRTGAFGCRPSLLSALPVVTAGGSTRPSAAGGTRVAPSARGSRTSARNTSRTSVPAQRQDPAAALLGPGPGAGGQDDPPQAGRARRSRQGRGPADGGRPPPRRRAPWRSWSGSPDRRTAPSSPRTATPRFAVLPVAGALGLYHGSSCPPRTRRSPRGHAGICHRAARRAGRAGGASRPGARIRPGPQAPQSCVGDPPKRGNPVGDQCRDRRAQAHPPRVARAAYGGLGEPRPDVWPGFCRTSR